MRMYSIMEAKKPYASLYEILDSKGQRTCEIDRKQMHSLSSPGKAKVLCSQVTTVVIVWMMM